MVAERTIEFLEGNAVVVKYFMQENIFVVAEILKQIQDANESCNQQEGSIYYRPVLTYLPGKNFSLPVLQIEC